MSRRHVLIDATLCWSPKETEEYSMVDPSTSNETRPDPGSPPSLPRWVKVSGIVVVSVILLLVILQLTGVVQHGPGLH